MSADGKGLVSQAAALLSAEAAEVTGVGQGLRPVAQDVGV